MTFKTWMKQYRGDDTPFGDLAGDIKRDESFPSSKKFEKNADHFISQRACHEAMETFAEAFLQYFMEEC